MRPLLGSILYLLRDPCGVSTMTSTSITGSFSGCRPAPLLSVRARLSGPVQGYPATYRSHKGHLALKNRSSPPEINERYWCDWWRHRDEASAGEVSRGKRGPTA